MEEESKDRSTEASPLLDEVTKEDHLTPKNKRIDFVCKVIKTWVLWVKWVGQGIVMGLIGVCVLDFRDRLGCETTLADISLMGALSQLAGFVGPWGSGLLGDRLSNHRDIINGCGLLLFGVATGALPWCRDLGIYFLTLFLMVLGHSVSDSMFSVSILSMWGKSANTPIHLCMMGYPLGMALGALMAIPFLSERSRCELLLAGNTTANTSLGITPIDISDEVFVSTIEIPFFIVAMLLVLTALTLIAFKFVPYADSAAYRKWGSLKSVLSVTSCSGGTNNMATGVIIVLLFWYFFLNMAKDQPFVFILPFLVEGDLKFSKSEASLLEAVTNVVLLFARLADSGIVFFCPIQLMLFVEHIGCSVACILIATVGINSRTLMWVLPCVYKVFNAGCWPGGYYWANIYLMVTAMVAALNAIGQSFGFMVSISLSGYMLTETSPNHIWWLATACQLTQLCVMALLQIVASRHIGSNKVWVQPDAIETTVEAGEETTTEPRETSKLLVDSGQKNYMSGEKME